MDIITINEKNIDEEHICCAIGNDKENKARAQTKKNWLKARFADGLVFKRLDARGKVFIEYMPIEKSWKPLAGKNFLVINCLWVSGQFKGKGYSTELLNECIKDAKKQKKDGIAVVSSDKVRGFLTDKKFFLKHGFEIADTAEPYFELLVLRINKKAEAPQFTKRCKTGQCENKMGLAFIYSHQCPFMEEYVKLLSDVARSMKIPATVTQLTTYNQAQKIGSPFGTLGIYYNGDFLTHELMTEAKFRALIKELA